MSRLGCSPHTRPSKIALVAVSCSALFLTSCSAPVSSAPPDGLGLLVNHSAPIDDLSGAATCASIVVAPDVALTATHCLSSSGADTPAKDVQVGAGNICSTAPISGSRVEVTSEEIIDSLGDLSILHLSQRVGQSVEIATNAPQEGDVVTAWGWGAEHVGEATACLPEPKMLRVVPLAECAEVIASTAAGSYFCAVATDGSRNTCTGDSGGAQGRLVGITSSGAGCDADDAGTYVDATSITPW